MKINIKKKTQTTKIQSLVLQLGYSFVWRFVLRDVFGVKYIRAENLLLDQQFVIIANHRSHMDTICLLSAIPRRKIIEVKPIAAQDYFGKTKLRAKLSNFFLNTLLIKRKLSHDIKEQSIDKILKAIDEGYSLIIYPEGTRNKQENLQELKKGIGYILEARPQLYYIPTYLKGTKQLLSFKNMVKPSLASITFGTPSIIQTSNKDDILNTIANDLLRLSHC